jgi:hypothetical protein
MNLTSAKQEISALVLVVSLLLAGLAFFVSLCFLLALIWRNVLLAWPIVLVSPFVCGGGLLLGVVPSIMLYRKSRNKIDLISLRLCVLAVCVMAVEALFLLLVHLCAPEFFPGISLG